AVVSLRQEEPIEDIGTLMQQEPFSSLDADQKQALSDRLGVASEYFQVMVDVEVAGNLSRLVSRVRRSAGGGADGTRVYSRQVKPLLSPLEPACNPFYNAGDDNNNVIDSIPGT
ncbi:MAG TPA: general secretion pathway protein GspK, partial [Alcanivorax sp.]|nr:general secretion pathway protein GspK [Alcanivorax sp.]HAD46293.1 general secretion pathway protein GspK [Alcanivorax sp.]HAR60647.1 general secretion pathway protein GspK [Alcanivorax sp.]HAV67762.1 general secretion pathway protein GspK [Alcanivorax sp.]HBS13598.1 general secretion pathway protein GspK [Alcanivorax sp.]